MRSRALLLLVALLGATRLLAGQAAVAGGPAGSGRAAFLEVLRTRGDMELAAAELARADALFARAMLAPSERDERRAAYARARLAHLAALLAAEDRAAHVVIERAVKSRSADGRLRVALTLRNATPAPGTLRAGAPAEADSVDEMAGWGELRGATVAIKADAGPNGATISRPYERAVPVMAPGQARTVALDLLEDATDAVVAVGAGDRTEERRIRLEVVSPTNGINVDAAQFSLEGELGGQVLYDLRLERPRPTASATRVRVRGLPPEVTYEIRDPAGSGRLGQLRFADGATTARVQLALSLPARPSPALRPDVPLAFDVIAADEGADPVDGDASRGDRAAIGRARLELVPRGVARVELRPATLALEARDDTATALSLTVRNSGSGRVDDLRLRADLPTHWTAEFRPATIGSLAAGDERRVAVTLHPPRGVAVGDYELRLGADAGAARRIDVEDKLVRVRVVGGGGLAGTLLGSLVAVGLTALAVVYGRRWVNR